MMKKFVAIVLALSVLMSLAIVCPAGVAEEATEPIVINVWSEDIETTIPFNEAFTKWCGGKYVIEFTPVKNIEMVAKVQSALAAGADIGDLILVDYVYRGLFYDMDILEDISKDPYNFDPDTVLPAYVPLQTTPAGAYTGPEYVAVGSMAYKRNLTEKYFGVTEPADVEALFGSWDEFKELGLKVKEASNDEAFMLTSVGSFYNVLRGQQEGLYINGTELTLKSYLGPIFDRLIDFTQAGIIDVLEEGSNEESASYGDDLHIFYAMPSYNLSQVLKPNDPEGEGRWGMILPTGKGYALPSGAMLVPKAAKNKEGAVEYLKFTHNTIEGATAALKFKSSFVSNKTLYEEGANFYTLPDPFFAGQDIWQLYSVRALGELKNIIMVTKYDNDFTDACKQALLTINATRGQCNTDDLLNQIADDLMMKHPELTRKD